MQEETSYDIIIGGAGGAGLLLAWELAQSRELPLSVLVLDKAPKQANDRTWSFWTKDVGTLQPVIYRQWEQLRFQSNTFSAVMPTHPLRYYTVRASDFYAHVFRLLQNDARFSIQYEEIYTVEEQHTHAVVHTAKGHYRAKHVFDSRISPTEISSISKNYTLLWQHFKGWVIQTETPAFDPATPTLFDFDIPQEDSVQFVYILPFSATEALVEYTLFSEQMLQPDAYDAFLKTYLSEHINSPYVIQEKEFGVIPMTDAPFPTSKSPHIHYIGTKGGLCKASSGYAFWRMHQDAQAIVKGMANKGIPRRRRQPWRFWWYDAIILHQMKHHGGKIAYYFSLLFRKHKMTGMLAFLDEQTNPFKELQIMATVPPLPFISSFLTILKRFLFNKKAL